MPDTFDYSAALKDAFSALDTLGNLKLNKAREDALIARQDKSDAENRAFHGEQAQLNREVSRENNADNNRSAQARIDRQTKYYETKAAEESKKEEERLKGAALSIDHLSSQQDGLLSRIYDLGQDADKERDAAHKKEVGRFFAQQLDAPQRALLVKQYKGDPDSYVSALIGSPKLQTAAYQQLDAAYSQADKALARFIPSNQKLLEGAKFEFAKITETIKNTASRSPGFEKYSAAPAAPSAPPNGASNSGPQEFNFNGSLEAAQANRAGQNGAPATPTTAPGIPEVGPQLGPQIPRVTKAPADILANPPRNGTGFTGNEKLPITPYDRNQILGIPQTDLFMGTPGQFPPTPRTIFDPPSEIPPGATQENQRVMPAPNGSVPQGKQTAQSLPNFSPASFARDNFGIDLDNFSPDDQQGMLRLAMRDGFSQQDVAGLLERVKQADPSAIQFVKKYHDQWNATKGSRPPQQPLDLASMGLA